MRSQEYKEEDLNKILFEANKRQTPLELLKEDNFHIKYLQEYLGHLGLRANYYVEEDDYISVDYLTDYSLYYSKSYNDYANKCVRLHFFSSIESSLEAFNRKFQNAILSGTKEASYESELLWSKEYLGFVVIRPIPKFLIGYTLLKTYNYNEDTSCFDPNRQFWATKDYSINVFGCSVKIKSLAFSSQDGNVGACATIAVWSLLQMAAENYFVNLKSPYEITKDAALTAFDGNRMFPNSGLNLPSICSAITKCNLATEVREVSNIPELNIRIKKYVNAYSKVKVPLILGIKVPTANGLMGHAVAICGHRYQQDYFKQNKTPWNKLFGKACLKQTSPRFRAESIDRIYMHDDQWGPYSRGEFVGKNEIITSWTQHTEQITNAETIAIIAAVFQKIRIPFEDIEEAVTSLDRVFVDLMGKDEVFGEIMWDIQLQYSCDFKEDVQLEWQYDPEDPEEINNRLNFLTQSMPKYIWIATLYIDKYKMLYFIFDATGLRHTNTLLFIFSYYVKVLKMYRLKLQTFVVQNPSGVDNLEFLLNDSVENFLIKLSKFITP
jgi:hypothetical protein